MCWSQKPAPSKREHPLLNSIKMGTDFQKDDFPLFGFAGYEEEVQKTCTSHGELAERNPTQASELFSVLHSLKETRRLLVCSECLDVLTRFSRKESRKTVRKPDRRNGRTVEVFSMDSAFLKAILQKLFGDKFSSLERPQTIFNIPQCCLKTKNIPEESFSSGFSAFIQLPNTLSFKKYLNFCKKLVSCLNKNTTKCICVTSKKTDIIGLTMYLSLLFGVYTCISTTKNLSRLQNKLMHTFRHDYQTRKHINCIISHFVHLSSPKIYRPETVPVKTDVDIKPDIKPRSQSALGFSTGKEEIETIDGVNFITFETESDMLEFTLLENGCLNKTDGARVKSTKKSGRIVPTKTKDITKIKGWRNKSFFTSQRNMAKMDVRIKLQRVKIKEETKIEPFVPRDSVNLVNPTNLEQTSGRTIAHFYYPSPMKKIMKAEIPFEIKELTYFPVFEDSNPQLSDYDEVYKGHIKDWNKRWRKLVPMTSERYWKKHFCTSDCSSDSESDEVITIHSSDSDEESSPRRRQLSLLRACKEDNELDNLDENPYEKSSVKKLPFIVRCSPKDDDHASCFDGIENKDVSLAVILNIGHKRPLRKEVVENIEQLRRDETTIDCRWANIAASACRPKRHKRTIKRLLIPVVSQKLIEIGKKYLHDLPVANKISKPTDASLDTSEVEKVVKSLINYVVRKEKFEEINIPSDPDLPSSTSSLKTSSRKYEKSKVERELRKLINVTLVDECRKDYSYKGCGNEYCAKGCICHSLDGKVSIAHCGKESCMFDCTCHNREEFTSGDYNRKNSLAKEESSWHQTVICKNNDVIEIRGEKSKSKRQKKLPTRYRNNVLLGKEMSSVSPASVINWRYPHLPNRQFLPRVPSKKVETKTKSSPIANIKPSKDSPSTSSKPSKESLSTSSKPSKESQSTSSKPSKESLSAISKSKDSPSTISKPSKDSSSTISKNSKDSPSIISKTSKDSPSTSKSYSGSNQKTKSNKGTPKTLSKVNSSDKISKTSKSSTKDGLPKRDKQHEESSSKDTDSKSKNITQTTSVSWSKKEKPSDPKDVSKKSCKEILGKNASHQESFKDSVVKDTAKDTSLEENTKNTSFKISSKNTSIKVSSKNASTKDTSKEEPSTEGISKNNSTRESSSMDELISSMVELSEDDDCVPMDSSTPVVLKNAPLKAKKTMPRPTVDASQNKHRLGDVYIWCSIHFCYQCSCSSFVYLLKCSIIVYRPNSFKERITIPQMANLMRDTWNISSLHIYNRQDHSARTYGSVIDYMKRNQTQTFKKKRSYEIQRAIICYSNSFMKLELPSRRAPVPPSVLNTITTKVVKSFDLSCDAKKLPKPDATEGSENPEDSPPQKKLYRIGPKYESTNPSKYQVTQLPRYAVEQLQQRAIMKRKYRIGPKHFNNSLQCRTIVTKAPRPNKPKGPSPSVSSTIIDEDCINLEDSDSEQLPDQGLLCLTRGFGWLPVKEYSNEKLIVQDPLAAQVYHTFKSVEAANRWLNKFFKSRMLFEELSIDLSWVIAKKGILMKSKPFDSSILLRSSNKMINKDGILVCRPIRDRSSSDNFRVSARKAETYLRHADNVVDLINVAATKRPLEDASKTVEQPPKKIKLEDSDDEISESPAVESTSFGSSKPSKSSEESQQSNPVGKNSSSIRIDGTSRVSDGCFIPLVSTSKNDVLTSLNKRSKSIVLTRAPGSSPETCIVKQKSEPSNK